MANIKTFDTKGLKHNQAVKFIEEAFEKYDMKETSSQITKDSINVIKDYIKESELNSIMWKIVKGKLKDKQLLYVIEEMTNLGEEK